MGSPDRHSSRRTSTTPAIPAGEGPFAPLPSYIDGSLIDPRFDFDSCGVGFVAQLSAEPSHAILRHALTRSRPPRASRRCCSRRQIERRRRRHHRHSTRVAAGADAVSRLDESSPLGVAVIFLPGTTRDSRAEIEAALFAAGPRSAHLAARSHPARGPRRNRRFLAPCNLARAHHRRRRREFFDRRLFLARKQFERSELPGYVVSISSSTMIYKALCAGRLLADFYPDLADPAIQDALRALSSALRHQRAPLVGARAALPHPRAQRRNQHHLGQSRAHGSSRRHACRSISIRS